jgi:hypothetical protein
VFSAALLLQAVVGPYIGTVIDRHGGASVLALSNLVLAAGLGTPGWRKASWAWRSPGSCSGSA